LKTITVLFLLFALNVQAFPSNTRYGYANCQSCHLSPAGGGVLTQYGKMSEEEFLSSWAKEGEGGVFHFAKTPQWLSVGGDARSVYVTTSSKTYEGSRFIGMQADLELGLRLTPNLFLVPSAGVYNNGQQFESRRHYVLLNLNEQTSIRAGRFFPAYGVLFPDHTLYTRKGMGFDQGNESYNVEFSYKANEGEVFVTGILAPGSIFSLSGLQQQQPDQPATEQTFQQDEGTGEEAGDIGQEEGEEEGYQGFAIRGALFLGKKSQVGFSGLYLITDAGFSISYGPYAMVGFTKELYLLGEFDLQYATTEPNGSSYVDSSVGTMQIGYEFYKGLHAVGTVEQKKASQSTVRTSAGVLWYPRPHFETSFTLSRETTAFENVDFSVLLFHYYF